MFTSKLASLFVEINSLGVQATAEQLNHLKAASEAAAKSLNESAGAATNFGAKALMAYDMAKNSVMGFYNAGIAGSAEMVRFQTQMTFLSREVAAVFAPALDKATATVESLVGWMRNLSGAQQDSLLKFAMGAAGAATMAVVLPKVIAGVYGLGVAIRGLVAGGTGGLSALVEPLLVLGGTLVGFAAGHGGFSKTLAPLQNALKGIGTEIFERVLPAFERLANSVEPLIAPLADHLTKAAGNAITLTVAFIDLAAAITDKLVPALTSLNTSFGEGGALHWLMTNPAINPVGTLGKDLRELGILSQGVRERSNNLGKHRNVAANDVGFEDIGAAYRRIQTSFLKATSNIPEQQLEVQRRIADNTADAVAAIERIPGGLQ